MVCESMCPFPDHLKACAPGREGAGLDLCCPDQPPPGPESIDTERSRIGIYFRHPEAFDVIQVTSGRGPRSPAGPAPLPLLREPNGSPFPPQRPPPALAGAVVAGPARAGAGAPGGWGGPSYGATSARRRMRISGSMTRARVTVACSPTSSAATEAVPSPALKAPTRQGPAQTAAIRSRRRSRPASTPSATGIDEGQSCSPLFSQSTTLSSV